MIAFVALRYLAPIERILQSVDGHRAYMRSLHDRGILLASGPFEPRTGGGLLVRTADEAELAALLAADPFAQERLVEHTIYRWAPNIGADGIDSLPLRGKP